MLASKLLQHSRCLLKKSVPQTRLFGESLRRCHTMGVPARVKLSTGEKAVYFVVLFASLGFIPFWILYHIPDYQKENRHEYTGK